MTTDPASTAATPPAGQDAAGGPPPRRRPASSEPVRRLAASAEDVAGRWPLGRIIAVGMLLLGLVLVAAIVVGTVALGNLTTDRNRVVNTIDPAAFHGSQLYAALLNQESGLRGYLLSGQQSFLQPYALGLASQRTEVAQLDTLLAQLPAGRAYLNQVLAEVSTWRSVYAEPAMRQVAATGKPLVGANIATGKADFDRIRAPLSQFQAYLSAQHKQAEGPAAQLSDGRGCDRHRHRRGAAGRGAWHRNRAADRRDQADYPAGRRRTAGGGR